MVFIQVVLLQKIPVMFLFRPYAQSGTKESKFELILICVTLQSLDERPRDAGDSGRVTARGVRVARMLKKWHKTTNCCPLQV